MVSTFLRLHEGSPVVGYLFIGISVVDGDRWSNPPSTQALQTVTRPFSGTVYLLD